MAVPNDVTVSRQVLAEPDATVTENTWVTLADGTPLVTAARRGKGMIVLFHVTGDTRWSDLPLSGTFVEMLKRIVALAGTANVTQTENAKTKNMHEAVAPNRVLDGFGFFVSPPSTARPVPTDFSGSATADHPPGFYGPPENLLAVNTLTATDRLAPLDFSALANASHDIYRKTEPQDLRGPIFLAALGLLLLDTLLVLYLGGGIARLIPRMARATAATVLIALGAGAERPARRRRRSTEWRRAAAPRSKPSSPMSSPAIAMSNSISKAGLGGLTLFLAQRTALEAGEPAGLDITRDELAFYPLIYWPIVPGAARPSDQTLKRDRFLYEAGRHGFVRHPRLRLRPRRAPAAIRAAPACSNCAKSCHRSTSPSLSRCRAITF